MFINPQLDADMTRIGCRLCAMDPCYMCRSCEQSNGLKCEHLDRWKRIKEERHAPIRKQHQELKKRYMKMSPEERERRAELNLKHGMSPMVGGKRECESGYRDDGLTCFRDLHCDTNCSGTWYMPWTWHCDTSCSGPSMYGKYDEEFKGAFQAVGNFFKNLPSVIMDAFSPNGPLAHVFDPNLNGVADGLRKFGDDMKNRLENAFDPEKNGVGAAVRKFGADIEKGFEDMGNKLKDAFSAESMNRAFGPMVAAFNSFGESMNQFFSDPSNILGFITMCMSTIAAVLPPPFSMALSVLASCTQMIGDACLGKPFDPMNLMDLGMAIACPQAKLASTIAKTTVKATTIIKKMTTTVTTTAKNVIAQAKQGVKTMAQMSTKDKALLAGKTLAKCTGKLGTAVVNQNPVESQQTPAQRAEDQAIGEDLFADAHDPVRQENSDAVMEEIDKAEYEQALREERDAGTIEGEYRSAKDSVKIAKKETFTHDEVDPPLTEMVQRANKKPKSYLKDEKVFFWRDATSAEREAQLAENARKTAEAKEKQTLSEARLEKDKTDKQIVDDKRWADRQEFKADNERRKYGFTYEEALERLKLYQVEQDKFKTATGTVPVKNLHPPKQKTNKGGIRLVDATPPEFMMSDVEDRGEGDFGSYPYLPPIFTPTFFHFVKEKFSVIPKLADPDNWFQEFNKFWDCYNRQKINYQKMIDANKIALDTRKKMTRAEKDKAFQEWLSSDLQAENPINLAVAAKAKGKQAFLDFIESNGFTEHTWNAQMKVLGREDLFIDEPAKRPVEAPAPRLIVRSDEVFKVPEAFQEEPEGLSGGAVDTPLVEPNINTALQYFKYILVSENPLEKYTDLDVRRAWEEAWENKPQETLAAINAWKLSPPNSQIGKGRKTKQRRRSISHFFELRGGDDGLDLWATEEASGTQVNEGEVSKVKSSKHEQIKSAIDEDTREAIAHELWGADLPGALQEYLAATPQDKRATRAKVQAYRDWAKEEYGDVDGNDPWELEYNEFEQSIQEKAPELNNEGINGQIPQVAFEDTDEGRADVALHAESSQAERDALNAEATAFKKTKEFEDMTKEEQWLFNDWKKTFDEEYKAAVATGDDDGATRAIEKFNGHFQDGDVRKLSGSGERPPPTMVLRNLWLGNRDDAGNKAWLTKHKIHTVFNVTPDIPKAPVGKTVRFSINDSHDDEDKMLKNGVNWATQIITAMEDGPVLVHCREGRQRSATLVALVMGLKKPQGLNTIIKKLRSKRAIALMPEPTFEKALKKWFQG